MNDLLNFLMFLGVCLIAFIIGLIITIWTGED